MSGKPLDASLTLAVIVPAWPKLSPICPPGASVLWATGGRPHSCTSVWISTPSVSNMRRLGISVSSRIRLFAIFFRTKKTRQKSDLPPSDTFGPTPYPRMLSSCQSARAFLMSRLKWDFFSWLRLRAVGFRKRFNASVTVLASLYCSLLSMRSLVLLQFVDHGFDRDIDPNR